MKKILIVFLLFVSYSFSQQKTSNIYAIIIGNSKFKTADYKIKYADSDAQMFYNLLKSKYFGKVPSTNLTLLLNEQIIRADVIDILNKKLDQAKEEDLVIIYIATKGLLKSGEVYFACFDTDSKNISASAISQKEIEKALIDTKAGNKIWIIDASYSGGAGDKVTVKKEMIYDEYLREYDPKINCTIFSSTSVDENSKESEKWGGGHGVFTHYLVEGLKGRADTDKDSQITMGETYDYVYKKVIRATDSLQHPQLKGIINSNLILSRLK